MGYNKFITYGNTVETYTYERSLPIRGDKQRKHSRRAILSSVAVHRKDQLSPGEFEGKRKDNAKRAGLVFRRLVLANLTGSEYPLLLTATYGNNETDLHVGYRDFGAFIQALRHKYGKTFRYIAVPEFQRRGAVHFHALLWGLPQSVFDEERSTRMVAKLWKHGFIYLKMTDGNEKLSSYLTKYMAKSFTDHRLMNQKAYVCSRNLIRPVTHSSVSNFALDVLMEEFEVKDTAPVIDKKYNTHWLGKGRHRIYKLSTENPQNNPSENLSCENIESKIIS